MMRKEMVVRESAINLITNSNRLEEKELQSLLAPIDTRLTVIIFGTANPFEWEVAVGYNGKNNYQLGERFRFGINRLSLRPFVTQEEFCIGFEESEDIAIEWLRQTVALRLWNHFKDRPDRVLKAVDPLEWWRQYGA